MDMDMTIGAWILVAVLAVLAPYAYFRIRLYLDPSVPTFRLSHQNDVIYVTATSAWHTFLDVRIIDILRYESLSEDVHPNWTRIFLHGPLWHAWSLLHFACQHQYANGRVPFWRVDDQVKRVEVELNPHQISQTLILVK